MLDSIPSKYAKRIDSLSNASGRYVVGLKAGWYVRVPGQHKFTEDEMKDVIATMHWHTHICECVACESKGKSL